MKITRIVQQKTNKKRYSLYIDGVYTLSLDFRAFNQYELYEGQEVTEQDLNKMVRLDEKLKAREYGELLLVYRDRSKKEMRERLKRKGYSDSIVEQVICELSDAGLLDENRFARAFIKDQICLKQKGKYYVKIELRKKGLQDREIETAWNEALPDEESAARSLVRKRVARYRKLDSLRRRKKLYDLLMRRGFSYEIIARVLEQELCETG